MRSLRIILAIILGLFINFITISFSGAAEIITSDSMVSEDELLKTADNVIILFDASTAMNRRYKNTKSTMYEKAIQELSERNRNLPDLGYNFGIYLFTPWKKIYPLQNWKRDEFEKALKNLPSVANGSPLLTQGIMETRTIIEGFSGRSAIYIYTDGSDIQFRDLREPINEAKKIVNNHNVCFYIISTARNKKNKKLIDDLSMVNKCSRTIPFEDLIERPENNYGIYYVFKSEELNETKIAGLQVQEIPFSFDDAGIVSEFKDEIDALASFLKENPNAYVLLEGHTDNVGSEEYNLGLALRRAQSVASYLMNNYHISSDRIVVNYYGSGKPVSDNTTAEGRAKNRRVEVKLEGLKR